MRLGELIDLLSEQPPKRVVRYSDGTTPGGFCSWRGVYAELSLTPTGKPGLLAGDLLRAASKADGGTFEGWKGGDYTMDRDSPVWADGEGHCHYNMIIGHEVVDDVLVLLRFQKPNEYGWSFGG